MACSSVNRTDPVEKIEKALAMKKQQLMSNYRFIVVNSSVAVLCRGGSRGGLLGLQPPQTILSSPSHLYTRLTIAWHSSCHCMVSSRQAV